jgi:hypothetical protein
MNIAEKVKPELDRTDTLECVLSNLDLCRDLECQKTVLRHYAGGVARAERQRIRRELDEYAEGILSQAEEQREESLKLIQSAQEIKAMLDLPCLREYGGIHED